MLLPAPFGPEEAGDTRLEVERHVVHRHDVAVPLGDGADRDGRAPAATALMPRSAGIEAPAIASVATATTQAPTAKIAGSIPDACHVPRCGRAPPKRVAASPSRSAYGSRRATYRKGSRSRPWTTRTCDDAAQHQEGGHDRPRREGPPRDEGGDHEADPREERRRDDRAEQDRHDERQRLAEPGAKVDRGEDDPEQQHAWGSSSTRASARHQRAVLRQRVVGALQRTAEVERQHVVALVAAEQLGRLRRHEERDERLDEREVVLRRDRGHPRPPPGPASAWIPTASTAGSSVSAGQRERRDLGAAAAADPEGPLQRLR